MASLTRLLPSIGLVFTAGAWACLLLLPTPEGSDALLAGYYLTLLSGLAIWALCSGTPPSASGPTTLPTTATLLKTRGWQSVGSKTPSSGSGSLPPESSGGTD
jgi:alkylation response protein AidB-like acyl-CoA dehydrogenase